MFLSLTRLRLDKWTYLFKFLKVSDGCIRQAIQDPNCLGGATYLGPGLTFWTATLWKDEDSSKQYVRSGAHLKALPQLANFCKEAATSYVDNANALPSPEALLGFVKEKPKFYVVKNPSNDHTQKIIASKKPWNQQIFKKLLSICICWNVFGFSESPKCLLVSGLKKDYNEAFSQSKFLKTEQTARPCKEFESWEDLVEWVEKAPDNELPRTQPLLIVQAAHSQAQPEAMPGSIAYSWKEQLDQTYHLNKAVSPARAIYNHLRKLSLTRSVGAILESCHSSSVLAHKLISDRNELNHPSIENLCLVTSSLFNRPTFSSSSVGIDRLLLAKSGVSLETLFDARDAGMISSAAFEYSDISKSFDRLGTPPDFKRIIEIARSCPASRSYYAPILKIAESSDFTIEQYGQVQRLQSLFQVISTPLVIKDARVKPWADYLKTLPDQMTFVDLYRVEKQFKFSNPDYKNTILVPLWIHDLEESYKSEVAKIEKWAGKFKISIDYVTADDIFKWIEKAVESLPESNFEKLSPLQEAMAKSVIGLPLMEAETVNRLSYIRAFPVDPKNDNLSTQAVVKAFICGSQLEGVLKDPLDLRRRKACQKFKF